VLVFAGPNWLGSPQHLVIGACEIVLELVEYPLLYAGKFHYSAYYDTLADMANSVVGSRDRRDRRTTRAATPFQCWLNVALSSARSRRCVRFRAAMQSA